MPENRQLIESLLHQRTPVVFRAGGPSMTPTIRDGETVRIRPLQTTPLHYGSVVLYRIYGRLALHRLTFNQKRTNQCFVVGDAATEGGEWIPKSDILGIAEWVQHGNQTQRLNTRSSRIRGQIRYHLRPFRRILLAVYSAIHAHTPAKDA